MGAFDVDWDDLKTPRRETDDELRRRLLYVAGEGPGLTRMIQVAAAERLDALAEEFGLRRRSA